MFVVSETEAGRILTKVIECRKVVTADGEIVKFGKKKSVLLPKDCKISVCKVLPWEMHRIRMATEIKKMQVNSTIEEYHIGDYIGFTEENILLSSLEVLETL